MLSALAIALALDAAAAAPTTILVDGETVHLVCPVGVTTRLVVPDAQKGLQAPPRATGVRVTPLRGRPPAEIAIHPQTAGQATIIFHGETRRLLIDVQAVPGGASPADVEIRLQFPGGAQGAETAPPQVASEVPPEPRIVDVPFPDDDPSPAITSPAGPVSLPPVIEVPRANAATDHAPSGGSQDLTATGLVDLEDLVGAKPERLDRRITIAGHPELRAETLQLGARWTWAQLRLRGGANRTVAALTWRRGKQTGPVAHWRAEPDGKDLRLTLQLPRGEGRLAVMVQILGGARYDVSLTRPGIGELKDRIF